MLLKYYLNVCEMVPAAPVSTGITFVFTFHMRCISVVRFLQTCLLKLQTSVNTRSFPVITDSVSLHMLITQHGYFTLMTCFN